MILVDYHKKTEYEREEWRRKILEKMKEQMT